MPSIISCDCKKIHAALIQKKEVWYNYGTIHQINHDIRKLVEKVIRTEQYLHPMAVPNIELNRGRTLQLENPSTNYVFVFSMRVMLHSKAVRQ